MTKILQLLGAVMLDVEGLSLNENDIRRLQDPSVGGVILFARNFESREQVVNLIDGIRALRGPELLIAVDQEGGRVQRLKTALRVSRPWLNLVHFMIRQAKMLKRCWRWYTRPAS